MTWIDHKSKIDTSGGRLRVQNFTTTKTPAPEMSYSVTETAEIFGVDRQTIYKWVSADMPEYSIFDRGEWFKLPISGQIRIKRKAILKIQDGSL
jgi:hypothetical protein